MQLLSPSAESHVPSLQPEQMNGPQNWPVGHTQSPLQLAHRSPSSKRQQPSPQLAAQSAGQLQRFSVPSQVPFPQGSARAPAAAGQATAPRRMDQVGGRSIMRDTLAAGALAVHGICITRRA